MMNFFYDITYQSGNRKNCYVRDCEPSKYFFEHLKMQISYILKRLSKYRIKFILIGKPQFFEGFEPVVYPFDKLKITYKN